MASPRTVLFFTFPEYGQANVQLATAYELALLGVNVSIASFASLEPRVTHIQELVTRHRDALYQDGRQTGSVTFRECRGFPSYMEATKRNGLDITTLPHPGGVSGTLKSLSQAEILYFPWSPEENFVAIEKIKEIIATVQPEMVVIDTLFYLAMDACQLVRIKYMIILPNSIKDIALSLQPFSEILWKYPFHSSGFSFPLKWWQIPLNTYIFARLAMRILSFPRAKCVQHVRRSLGIKPPAAMEFHPGVRHICPALPETDFPFSVIPDEMVLCGPIVMPFDPLEEVDPELTAWLDEGITVMVNLGSHILSDKMFAREMAIAFRTFLKGTRKMQVLWKTRSDGDVQQVIEEVIGEEIEEGRVKVVAWLHAEPVSVLRHPNVVCTVHHGGANSFFEGVWSGMPHIILPVWGDAYDYAARAEFLKIGVFGNKTSAPGVHAEELGEALVRVTGNTEEAHKFRMSAKRLKAICRAQGEGRKLASAAILKELAILDLTRNG